MLQDLCPRCEAELAEPDGACVACGYVPIATSATRAGGVSDPDPAGWPGAVRLIWAAVFVVIAFAAGWQLGSGTVMSDDSASNPATTTGALTADLLPAAPAQAVGRVRFGERLGDSLQLEGYRRSFTRDDTIAWRAEFAAPPASDQLTLAITWVSVRERMQLRRETVMVADPELAMIGRDEIQLRDLVPTAGLYEVAYYDGDTKLAEGVFELLPSGP